MSEKPQPTQDEDFDALAESKKRASSSKQVYENFMERDAEAGLTPEEHSEAYQQMSDYLQSRPYRDRSGKLHDPITGSFIGEDEAGVFYRPGSSEADSGEAVDGYENMSLSSLAALSAEAERHNDRTTMLSVDDAIQKRIIDMNLKDELVERDGSEREETERSMVLDHVMKLREQYLEKMKKDSEQPEDDKDKEDGPEDDKDKEDGPEDDKDKEDGPEDDKDKEDGPEEFNPWVKFGEVMEEVKDDLTQKEIGTDLDKEAIGKIAEIARSKIEGEMPKDEDEYYSGGEIKDDDPEKQEGPEDEPNLEISRVTIEALAFSRERYAVLSARRRGEILGGSKEELEAAKQEYEAAMKQVNEELMQILVESGATPNDARNAIVDSSIGEAQMLMRTIADKRIEESSNKRFAKFYQWYGRQRGLTGALKKFAATTAVTAPLGLAAGVAGLALLGPIAGAVAGAAMARGVAKALGAGKIKTEAGMETLAYVEGAEDVAEATAAVFNKMRENPAEPIAPETITTIAEETTRRRLLENRLRTAKVVTLGATIGAVSGIAADWIGSHFGIFGGGGTTGGGNVHDAIYGLPATPKPPGGVHDAIYSLPATPKPPVPGSFQGIPVLDGKPFISDVSNAGLVPKGMEDDLVSLFRSRGLDGGADITGFKAGRMFHTADGFSHFSDAAKQAVEDFYKINRLPFPKNFWDRFTVNP